MRDMFYNYDSEYRRKKKEYPDVPTPECPDTLYSGSNAEIVYDVWGNEIGIRAYRDRDLTLYFQTTGDIDGGCPLDYLRGCDITFKLLNAYGRPVLEKIVYSPKQEDTEISDWGVLKVHLTQADLDNARVLSATEQKAREYLGDLNKAGQVLNRDVYKIRLDAAFIPTNDDTDEARSFILFYENDATLSFI